MTPDIERALQRVTTATIDHMRRSRVASDPELTGALHELLVAVAAQPKEPPPWLTVDEAARRFRVSKETVYRLAREGSWPKCKLGRSVRVASSGPETTGDNTTTADDAGHRQGDLSDQESTP